MPRSLFTFAVLMCLPLVATAADTPTIPLKLPPGFTVTLFADHTLADDIFFMNTDERGRTIVAGPGYIRWLQDTNGDGVADKATDLITGLKEGPMGILWENDTLYVTVDGGLKRYYPCTGKTPATNPEVMLKLKTGGEHTAHAIRRGGDGWLYVLGGDGTGFGKQTATSPTSPIKDPIGGCLIRMSADDQWIEIVADGFRNPYSFDFDVESKPFTYDSDNERCISLPWYEGCRFYQIHPGGHYGWMAPQHATTWRKPPFYPDVVRPVSDLGRGSPTGVACYRHTSFPGRYQKGFFLGDWTHGRIWYVPPGKDPQPEVFAVATGDAGFAVTGISVDPTTGDLLASVGGRGTRGAVYRIHHKGAGQPIAMKKLITPKYADTTPPAATAFTAVRNLQQALGGIGHPRFKGTVFEGYTFQQDMKPTEAEQFHAFIVKDFPSADRAMNREKARLAAGIASADPAIFAKVLAQISATTDPVEDIHYLIVLARLQAPRTTEQTNAIAEALLALDAKLDARKMETDRNWPLRIREMVNELVKKDPQLLQALLASTQFGRAKHVLFATLPGFDQTVAARKFLTNASQNETFEWTAELVRMLGRLPEAEVAPWLAKLWDRGGLEDAVIALVARTPTDAHRVKFQTGLRSVSATTVGVAAKALAKLTAPTDATELAALITALRKCPDTTEGKTAAKEVTATLNLFTKQSLATDAKVWETWAVKANKAVAAQLSTSTGYDRAAWAKRLAEINWDAGDADKGKRIFAKATCAACHDGGRAVGPALGGVAQRFSKDDLLTALLDPARDVSQRYRPTRVTTTDGKVYEGLIVYDAKDALLLMTGPETTVKVEGNRIETRKPSAGTIMPAGLLDPLSNADVADLLAYLKGLKAK